MGSRVNDGGTLDFDGVQAAVVCAQELRGEGKSLRSIAATLAAEGHRPRGKRWHVETLSRIVAKT